MRTSRPKRFNVQYNTRQPMIKTETGVCTICNGHMSTLCIHIVNHCRYAIYLCLSLLSVHHILTTNAVAARYAHSIPFGLVGCWCFFYRQRINKNYGIIDWSMFIVAPWNKFWSSCQSDHCQTKRFDMSTIMNQSSHFIKNNCVKKIN